MVFRGIPVMDWVLELEELYMCVRKNVLAYPLLSPLSGSACTKAQSGVSRLLGDKTTYNSVFYFYF